MRRHRPQNGGFGYVLQTFECSQLDAGVAEKKHYATGVGFLGQHRKSPDFSHLAA
jgi:hypothetical protein